MSVKSAFSWWKVLARVLAGFFVVFITYNPTGYSYLHWLARAGDGPLPLKVAAGLLLLILFYVFLSVTYGAFRIAGVIVGALTAVLFSMQTLLFGLPEHEFESIEGYMLWGIYVVLMSLAIMIGFGLSWSMLIERLTGQEQKRYVRRAE